TRQRAGEEEKRDSEKGKEGPFHVYHLRMWLVVSARTSSAPGQGRTAWPSVYAGGHPTVLWRPQGIVWR
ncbi:MAG TPA: hypothetical protein VM537_35145, partial [Anaerolineae bacterium]|nr:hypothetical protein [Anaerolineae bacterium]